MSYESEMLIRYSMPSKKDVEDALLQVLFKHNGTVREFSTGEELVNELADIFVLNEEQRNIPLERIYIKENRLIRTPLWHRLLYRAADSLAKEKLVTRPTTTFTLTNKKEWMLTENGFDRALLLLNIPVEQKDILPIKSFEVQKLVNKIIKKESPIEYDPFDFNKKKKVTTKESSIRLRSFRQAIIESYDCKCSVCGLKLNSPNNAFWEVNAAHIVPHSANGKDDIWNGIALCSFHHWAFDVGWFSISNDYNVLISTKYDSVMADQGKIGEFDFINNFLNSKLNLPLRPASYPHINALKWHRENIFYK